VPRAERLRDLPRNRPAHALGRRRGRPLEGRPARPRRLVPGRRRRTGVRHRQLRPRQHPPAPALLRPGRRQAALAPPVHRHRADLTAYDPADGAERWRFAHDGISMIPSPTAADGRVYVAAGDLLAVEPPENGSPGRVAWRSNRLRTGMGSPLVHGGRVYTVSP